MKHFTILIFIIIIIILFSIDYKINKSLDSFVVQKKELKELNDSTEKYYFSSKFVVNLILFMMVVIISMIMTIYIWSIGMDDIEDMFFPQIKSFDNIEYIPYTEESETIYDVNNSYITDTTTDYNKELLNTDIYNDDLLSIDDI